MGIKQVREESNMGNRAWIRTTLFPALMPGVLALLVLLSGCAFSTEIPSSSPSGLDQLLILSSLERAAVKLHLNRYRGKRIYIDFFSQLSNDGFIKKYLVTLLQKVGADVVDDVKQADLTLKTFAAVAGIDHAESFIGLPAITPPVVGVTIPEIALYKALRDRGYTDLRIYAFDRRTGNFMAEESPRAIGKSKYNRYTVLIAINFTLTDVTQPVKPPAP
jgi:hypothetical protein